MNRILRTCGLVLAAGLAVGTTGCLKSANEGKLEGTKWSSAYVPDFKGMSGRGMTATLQFADGSRFSMEMRSPLVSLRCSGTYRLGAGETVYLDDVSPALGGQTAFTETITVAGDTLVFEDPDGTKIVFTKLDPATDKASKPAAPKGKTPPTADDSGETVVRSGKKVTRTYAVEPKKEEKKEDEEE